MTTPTPGPRGAAARLVELAAQQNEGRRVREDHLLAEAERLGDQAPALLLEVAADIREHRQMEARRRERPTRDAEQTQAAEPNALVAPPWRLAAPEAVAFASRVRQEHPDADVREAAQRLLDRYDTITGLAMYSRGVVDPDKVHNVLEDMRQLADQVTAAALSETAVADTYAATSDAVAPVRADEPYAAEFQSLATQHAATELADQWYRMGIAARDAAEWANAGFTPGEAEEHIAQGRTPHGLLETEAIEFHATIAESDGIEEAPSESVQAEADRYAAERARIEQAATTAAAGLRAQADLDRISEQVDRRHGDGEASSRAEPMADDVQEVGR